MTFAFAQSNSGEQGEEEEGGDDDEQMTYPEFLEGLARLAVMKYDDPRIGVPEKVRHTCKAVAALMTTPAKRRPLHSTQAFTEVNS